MLKTGGGAIVNTSSIFGLNGYPRRLQPDSMLVEADGRIGKFPASWRFRVRLILFDHTRVTLASHRIGSCHLFFLRISPNDRSQTTDEIPR